MKTRILLAVISLLLLGSLLAVLWRPGGAPQGPRKFAEQSVQETWYKPDRAPPETDSSARPDIVKVRGDNTIDGKNYQSLGEHPYSRGPLVEGSLNALLNHRFDALRPDETDDLPTLIYAFAERLRASGDEGIYAALADTLYDPLATPDMRSRVLTLLGSTATPQAVEALTDYLLSSNVKDEVRGVLRNSLQEAAYGVSDDNARRRVVSILARTWERLDAGGTVEDQAVVAEGIAYLSTAEGIQTMLSTLTAPYRGDDQRREIAATALSQLQRNEAVPVLASVLKDVERDTQTAWAAISGLVSINSADAFLVLMEDLEMTDIWDEEGMERLEQILFQQHISDEAIGVIRNALDRQMFEDIQVTALLDEVLAGNALGEADEIN